MRIVRETYDCLGGGDGGPVERVGDGRDVEDEDGVERHLAQERRRHSHLAAQRVPHDQGRRRAAQLRRDQTRNVAIDTYICQTKKKRTGSYKKRKDETTV